MNLIVTCDHCNTKMGPFVELGMYEDTFPICESCLIEALDAIGTKQPKRMHHNHTKTKTEEFEVFYNE